jgi:hypothetical protein
MINVDIIVVDLSKFLSDPDPRVRYPDLQIRPDKSYLNIFVAR